MIKILLRLIFATSLVMVAVQQTYINKLEGQIDELEVLFQEVEKLKLLGKDT